MVLLKQRWWAGIRFDTLLRKGVVGQNIVMGEGAGVGKRRERSGEK